MKLAIGTAQFGMDYGLSNKLGKSKKYEVSKILKYAHSQGVDLIDTAPSYGDSENILGNLIHKYDFRIVTKTPKFDGNFIDNFHSVQLYETFCESLINLGEKASYGLLVHSCDDLLKPGGELLYKKMQDLKSIGMVEKIGVSVYSSLQINSVLDKFKIDIIQLPINIFDQQLFVDGSLEKLKNKNIEIHARSVFLQGLLLMNPLEIPQYFLPIQDKIKMFSNTAKSLSLSKLELALNYVNEISEIDKIVVGVNKFSQFNELVNAKKIKINPIDFIKNSINNPQYTHPMLWKI
jgi:aryl-alcohol dehydrogenase-like predicted oxidoreductase